MENYQKVRFHQINVAIHFRDPAMAKAIECSWRDGTQVIGETSFISYFYSSNVANVIKYLNKKKRETQFRWKVGIDMITEVEDEDIYYNDKGELKFDNLVYLF